MRTLISIVVSLSVLAVTGPALAQSSAMSSAMTVPLLAENGSGEKGTATITPVSGGVRVTLSLTGAPAGVPQPAHIHNGTCSKLGSIKWPLQNVVNGKSTTTIQNLTIATLMKGTYAINVHKSIPQIAVYVACGNVSSGHMAGM